MESRNESEFWQIADKVAGGLDFAYKFTKAGETDYLQRLYSDAQLAGELRQLLLSNSAYSPVCGIFICLMLSRYPEIKSSLEKEMNNSPARNSTICDLISYVSFQLYFLYKDKRDASEVKTIITEGFASLCNLMRR